MKNKLQILLTGASGTVGYEVLKQLSEKHERFYICVLDLKTSKSKRLFKPYAKRIKIIYGDISNIEDSVEACKGKDIVIHLAAIIPPIADEHPELAYKVNTVGTKNLITNLEKYSPETFFIYSSSISVYGDRLANPQINVGDPLIPSVGDEYALTKIKAEEIITNCNLKWSIFRLSAVMGNHKASKLMFHMPLETKIEITTPGDTARAFVNALEKRQELSGRIFNLGGGVNCRTTYKEFLNRSFHILGLGKANFPEKSFAEKNFHCGYYNDSDELNRILNFVQDDLNKYYKKVKESTSFIQRALSLVFKVQIKKSLLKQSEPRNAIITKNHKLIERFFNKA